MENADLVREVINVLRLMQQENVRQTDKLDELIKLLGDDGSSGDREIRKPKPKDSAGGAPIPTEVGR